MRFDVFPCIAFRLLLPHFTHLTYTYNHASVLQEMLSEADTLPLKDHWLDQYVYASCAGTIGARV